MTALPGAANEAPSAAAAAAIDWMVKLQSGQATPQDHQACQRWQRERPEHAQAWATLDALSQRLKTLPPALAHGTLARPSEHPPSRPARRALLKGALLLGGAGGTALITHSHGDWHVLAAAHRTGVGERQRVALQDGSVLHLNTATALDAELNAHARCLTLHAGEVLVECAADHAVAPPRPFLVRTAEGTVQAREGRFVVRQLGGRTNVQALSAWLDVRPHRPDGEHLNRQLGPGQQWAFDAAGAGAVGSVDHGAAAWADGLLVARDMPLAVLAAELARYRRGWLRCERAVAALRVSGVFPVDDIGRVVAALQRTLPVRARSVTSWWITLAPR